MDKKNKGIIINDLIDFDIKHILECGQIFRYNQLDDKTWQVFSLDKMCSVVQDKNQAFIECDDIDYFENYFDLSTNYSSVKDELANLPFMAEAIKFGYGIRILRQNSWEMLISFIISANNHIPRIKGIIERLCAGLGEYKNGYYAFPTPQAMAEMSESYYVGIGAGYRAKYLAETSKAVANGFDMQSICGMNGLQGNKELCKLLGVGPKVADCILLFGYHKLDVFPVDTWIKKVYCDIVGESCGNNLKIRQKLLEIYGDLSGYAQQYLFFNKREN